MMERLRERLWLLRQSFCKRRKTRVEPAPIKGNMQNVIVVKPENKMFSHAVFVLSDDYVRQNSLSSQELLRQAREAAGEYSSLIQPRSQKSAWLKAVLAALAALAFLLAAYYFIFM